MKSFSYLAFVLLSVQAGWVSAQDKIQTPSTKEIEAKVALLDVGAVWKKSIKYQALEKDLQRALEPAKQEAEQILAEMDKYSTSWRRRLDKEAQLKLEKELFSLKCRMEALDLEAKKLLTKIKGKRMSAIYQELTQVVDRYAKANKIQLVLAYKKPEDDGHVSSDVRCDREIQWIDNGTTILMYYEAGVDITEPITALLNQLVEGKPLDKQQDETNAR